MDVSVAQMRVVEAVARTRSFSRAADELFVGQPVVSRTVRSVERSLRAALFTRTTRQVELTDAGRAFLDVARGVLSAVAAGTRQWEGYLDAENGLVTVAALPSFAATVLPAAVTEFVRDRPGRAVVVRDVPAREAVDLVRSGRVDLAVCDVEQVQDAAEVDVRLLATEDVVAVLAPGSGLATLGAVTWTDLSHQAFIALETGSSVRRLSDRGFAAVGRAPGALVTTRSVATVAGLVAAGLGTSAVPRGVLPLMDFADLAVRPLGEPAVTRRIALVSQRVLPPVAQRFREALARAVAASQVPART